MSLFISTACFKRAVMMARLVSLSSEFEASYNVKRSRTDISSMPAPIFLSSSVLIIYVYSSRRSCMSFSAPMLVVLFGDTLALLGLLLLSL